MIQIDISHAANADVSAMAKMRLGATADKPDYEVYEFNKIGGGIEKGTHNKMLHYLSNQVFKNEILLDLGTCAGWSAFALALSKKNKIISYDIATTYKPWWDFIKFRLGYNNIEFRVQDCNTIEPELLLSSPFILLDIDPHDGYQEKRFFKLLRDINYDGLVMLDDSGMKKMKHFIDSIIEPTYDATHYGHGTGTMFVDFSYGKRFKFLENGKELKPKWQKE